jgi:trans-aconitate methyltransferase
MSTERFSKMAAGYDKKLRRRQLAESISTAIAKLPLTKAMDGMEFGCGTGLVGMLLAPKLGTLTALDTSQGMLDVLQQKIDAQCLDNVQCLNTDIFQKNHKQRYDLIICSMTLHHLQDTTGLLQRFMELLNPGGYLAIADLYLEDGTFHDASAEGIFHTGFNTDVLRSILGGFHMESIQIEHVHTIKKEKTGNEYPVFLLTACKQK